MRIEKDNVAREEVIRFYATYDCRKKKPAHNPDLDTWPWGDPHGLDQKLKDHGLKHGVLTAYRKWRQVKFDFADLLECAVVDHIFPGESQALSRLVLRGKLAEWFPKGNPEWWRHIGNGCELGVESSLIVRPSLMNELPAKWYLEDGSGRGLALLQRILRYGDFSRTAWTYLGHESDERSHFITQHPELKR